MPATTRRRLLTTSLLLSLPSCTSSPSNPEPAPAPLPPTASAVAPAATTSQPIGAHWVHDRQLRQVMASLALQKPSIPTGLPHEPESPRTAMPEDFDTVALLASDLMTSADEIPDRAKAIPMQDADRAGFIAEARTLRVQAQGLRDAARQQRIEQMQRQMDAINATCISCHSRYRDFAGQLNTAQTSAAPIPGLLKLPQSPPANQ